MTVRWMIDSKHLQIRNKTKQNKTKLVNHFDFVEPKQNKIILFLILVTKTKTKSKQNQPKQEQNWLFNMIVLNFGLFLVHYGYHIFAKSNQN
jgi:hypothetical protein